jgi:hypothetical protein
MEAKPHVDVRAIAQSLNAWGVRYLVIGGQAVLLHGIPLHSFDTDIWLDPTAREPVLRWLEDDLGFELSSRPEERRPLVTAYAGPERLDLFFAKAMTNRDGVTVRLDEAIARAERYPDPESGGIPIPGLDDLIALKRMSVAPRAKDEEAIRQLEVKKLMRQA